MTIPDSDIRKIIADNLRKYRERSGKTQEQLSAMANLSRNHVGYIERSELNLTIRSLNKIAIALEIKPYLLLMESSPD